MPTSTGAPLRATCGEAPGFVRRPRPHDPTAATAVDTLAAHRRVAARRSRPNRRLGALALCALAAACQSYERRPLDLEAHLAFVNTTRPDRSALADFVEHLAQDGQDVPERFDLADGLSVAEAEVLALFHNPDLRLARLGADVALAGREHAGLWEDPVFGFDAAQVLSPGSLLEYGLTLGVSLPLSGRLGVLEDLADARVEVAARRVVEAEWSLRFDVRRAWSAWSVARERTRSLAEVVEQLRGVALVTDRLTAVGELSRNEGRLVDLALVERELELAEMESLAAQRRIDVLALLGLAPNVALELRPEVAVPTANPVATEDLVAHNPRIALARARYRGAEEALRLEIRAQYPDLGLAGGYGSEDDDRFLFRLSLPIPLWNRNRAAIATARAERELARAVAETEVERVSVELALAQARLAAARASRERLVSDALPALDAQMEDVARLVDLGEVDLYLLLETATRRFELHSLLLDRVLEEADAAAAIAELLGPDARDLDEHTQDPAGEPRNDR
jgi:outer membrane protein, heavy metal efflux system